MKTMQMLPRDRIDLYASLAAMPDFLEKSFQGLSEHDARIRGSSGDFSPVEQIWHMADLEREGYAVRIRRLLTESDPDLPDFDGDQVAVERQYQTLSLAEGLATFRETRRANLERLCAVRDDEWTRSGMQHGVGRVSLCDIPAMMAAHDDSHRREIETWLRGR